MGQSSSFLRLPLYPWLLYSIQRNATSIILSGFGSQEELREVVLGILLAGLRWLSEFLADCLPLVVLIVLDRVQERRFLEREYSQHLRRTSCLEKWQTRRCGQHTSSSANSA